MVTDGRHLARLLARRAALDWLSVPIHPLLAASYPVIFLFAANAADQVSTDSLWIPLLIAVTGAAVVLMAIGFVSGDWNRAGLLTTVLVVGFFGYGHAWNAIATIFGAQWPAIVGWTVLIGFGLVLAWRAGPAAVSTTRALNFLLAALVAFNLWSLTATLAVASEPPAASDLSELALRPSDPDQPPDVYYIVLDRYGGATALREQYDFDNEPFLSALEERGFAVARHAHANYIKTALSLTSSLDLAFLDADALAAQATEGKDVGPIHRALRGPLAVPRALKEIGYEYLQIGNWWTPTQRNVDADRVFRYTGQDEFSSALLQTTLFRAFTDPDVAPDDPWDWRVMRENNLYALARLDEMPSVPGPKFVFAHLVTTHPPYVHNADGSFTGRAQVAELGVAESYRRQLRYANERMLRLVDRIIASDRDAIIMLQADEGPFPARYLEGEWGFQWRDATPEELEEKFGILYAMRVPGADLDAEGFHDALTPVNAFRLIFNARFGTDLPLLPDRTWAHTDKYHYYDFFEVTHRLAR